jgi:dTDP-4-dehydrorhamnose 3,5-epimerase
VTTPAEFRAGSIDGVTWKPLQKYHDHRGWLCELFRDDELPAGFRPAMAYISMSGAGITRGPHEHVEQTDCFAFLGPSNFKVYLWDGRPSSPTYRVRQVEVVGADRPMLLIIPPGVAHAYRNVGGEPGIVFNCPDRLFKGRGRKEPVDEIRHEDDPASLFRLE